MSAFTTRKLRFAGLALAALLTGGGLWFVWANAERSTGPPEKITLALIEQPAVALIHVAEEKGLFREVGLEVSYHKFALGRDALLDAIAGRADLATVYDLPVAINLYHGHDLAILSTLHSSNRGHAVVARRDRGIAAPADLRGKKIGVTPGTTTDYFLQVFLAGEGVAAAAVTTVPVEPGAYEAALLSGQVDAQVAFNPNLYALRDKLGPERGVVFYSDAYTEFSVLAGRRDVLAAKGEAVRRLLRALVRAEIYLRDHREESLAIVAKRLANTYSEASVRAGWDTLSHEARLSHLLLAVLTQEGNWLKNSGRFQTPVPDFEQALLREPLAAADPRAVTLLATAPERRP